MTRLLVFGRGGNEREDRGLAGRPGKKTRTRRHYRPTLEGLEAVRLLSGATESHAFSGVAIEHDLLTDSSGHGATAGSEGSAVSSATWDAALVETELAEILNPGSGSPAQSTALVSSTSSAITPQAEPRAIASGLSQLNKYLTRAWYRAGISAQLHDDSSQAVFTTLLQHLGRERFDSLIADIGQSGIQGVFNAQSSDGLTFFRAVDMVKKRRSASGCTNRWSTSTCPARRPNRQPGRCGGKPCKRLSHTRSARVRPP